MAFPLALSATFPENWPKSVADLSIRTQSITLSVEDTVALGAFTPEFRDAMDAYENYSLSDRFFAEIETALSEFPNGVFPRLGYCSWKASSVSNKPARTVSEVMSIISRPDERIARMLQVNAADRSESVLLLRDWMEIPTWAEFRLFFKARRLIGASQYFYTEEFPQIVDQFAEIRGLLTSFAAAFSEVSHLDNVVADVFTAPNFGSRRAGLIELNPFAPVTDPCLFSWKDATGLDGRLRFVKDRRLHGARLA